MQLLKRLLCSLAFLTVIAHAQNQAPAPNWAQPRYRVAPSTVWNNGWITRPTSTQIGFTFRIATAQRQTSAAVFNASGALIRTLWTNRAYKAGTYGEIWDGLDDDGNAATAGLFTIKVAYNNIVYNWDGIIGNSEKDWNGPLNQDAMISGFITAAPVLANQHMYAVTGYTEIHFNTPVFDRNNPNGQVNNFLPLLTGVTFAQLVSDGHRIYMLVQPLSGSLGQHGGVLTFTFNGQPWNLAGTPAAGRDISTTNIQVIGAMGGLSNPYPGITFLDATLLTTSLGASTSLTGLAVQQDGTGTGSCAPDGCLATAHGFYDASHGKGSSGSVALSTDTVNLWDKLTGASITSFTVVNPQNMVFDNSGNLWILSGYHGGAISGTQVLTPNVLYEVTGVGGSNTVTQIGASTFRNPIAIAINPVNGHLFVADGGTNQQIFEVSTSTPRTIISTLGVLNGYHNSGSCNANIDPAGHNSPTFWFDPEVSQILMQPTTPFVNWIQIDQQGDLWIGDFFAARILHYTWTGSAWNYVERIAQSAGNDNTFLLVNDPTRLFAGQRGMLEYSRNYSVPLQPGDPEAPGGNGSWDIVRNWWPCIEYTLGYSSVPSQWQLHDGSMLLPNGNPIGFVFSLTVGGATMGFQFNKNGTFSAKAGSYPPHGSPDAQGNSYSTSRTGTSPNITYTINKFPISGYDSNGFPSWGSSTPIGSYTANASLPQATNGSAATNGYFPYAPTSDGIIPIYQDAYSAPVGGAPVFHLGGLPVGGSSLKWTSAKQVPQAWMNGDNTVPGVNLTGVGQLGTTAVAVNQDIFAYLAGNNGPWGSNWMHFKSDGMPVGQFGYQTSFGYINALNPYQNLGYGLSGGTYPYVGLAPGLTTDVGTPYYVQVGSDYYVFIGDQAYRAGFHEWHISNLSSYGEVSASGALGSTITLQ